MEDSLGAGVSALSYLRQPGAAQQLQFLDGHSGHQIRRGLDAPIELNAFSDQSLGDLDCTLAIDEKVVVDDPEQLEVVSGHEIRYLVDNLICLQGIPLAPV